MNVTNIEAPVAEREGECTVAPLASRVPTYHTNSGSAESNKKDKKGRKLTVSMSRRFSRSCVLSLMSFEATQDLIWSRSRCSFFICVFKSVSSFSFCVWFVHACILSYILSKSSTPSETFFSVRSISAVNPVKTQHAKQTAMVIVYAHCSFRAAMGGAARRENGEEGDECFW